MTKILVVEDETNILNLMLYRLKKNGYEVIGASNGVEALKLIDSQNFDIIIADIMMPQMDGYELVEILRKNNNQTPVIFTTAKETLSDKMIGYRLGVDDYMIKPIEHDELILRIGAILKRTKPFKTKNLQINDLVIDYNTLTIKDKKQSIPLTKKEFDLIYILLSNTNHTFTKNELLDNLWGYNNDVYEETLKVHINRIRKKIKCFKQIDIQTIRGLGYKGIIYEQKK